jgi:hypothetical protein
MKYRLTLNPQQKSSIINQIATEGKQFGSERKDDAHL